MRINLRRVLFVALLGAGALILVSFISGCRNVDRHYYPPTGDVNGDGVVDELDVEDLEARLGIEPDVSCPLPDPADVNGDGFINARDVVALLKIIRDNRLCERYGIRCDD